MFVKRSVRDLLELAWQRQRREFRFAAHLSAYGQLIRRHDGGDRDDKEASGKSVHLQLEIY